ncbi:MAG TPA: hypothetical protein VFF57_08210 [Hanamia sp.]|nr:hypothetical protein [Hanamia sp.]
MKKFSLSALCILMFVGIYGQASKEEGALLGMAKLQAGGQGIGL